MHGIESQKTNLNTSVWATSLVVTGKTKFILFIYDLFNESASSTNYVSKITFFHYILLLFNDQGRLYSSKMDLYSQGSQFESQLL